MSYLDLPDEATAQGEVRRLYEADRTRLGYVANYTRVFALRPAVIEAWAALNTTIRAGMDLRRYELATLAAARRLRSSYCSLAHGSILREKFYDTATVARIASDHHHAGLAPVDIAVMDFAGKVAADATTVTAADVETLRGYGLDDTEILQVVLAAAARCFFSTAIAAAGAEPDAEYRTLLDPALRTALSDTNTDRGDDMTTSKSRPALNGVDTPTLFATLDAVKANSGLAKFQFRAANRWISGTHNRSTIRGFFGAGQEDTTRLEDFTYDADHPAVLVGTGNGPTPVEFLLHAIAACLTSGLANIAAARGVALREVTSTVEGDIDLLGILGLSDQVRNGYQGIRVSFQISGDAPDEVLRGLIDQSRARSAVYDVLTNGVPVSVEVSTG